MTTGNTYDVDTNIVLSTQFTNASGNPVDPDDVYLFILLPDGCTQRSYTLSNGQITRASIGSYYFELTLDIAGRWRYRWRGTGNAEVASEDIPITVKDTLFTIGVSLNTGATLNVAGGLASE